MEKQAINNLGIIDWKKLQLITLLYNFAFEKNKDELSIFKFLFKHLFPININYIYTTLDTGSSYSITPIVKQRICDLFQVKNCSELDKYVERIINTKVIYLIKNETKIINSQQLRQELNEFRIAGSNGTFGGLAGVGIGGLLGLLLFPAAPILGLVGGAAIGGLAGYSLGRAGGTTRINFVSIADFSKIQTYIESLHGKNADENDIVITANDWAMFNNKGFDVNTLNRFILYYNNRRVGGAPSDPTYDKDDYKLIRNQVKAGKVIINNITFKAPWRKIDMRTILATHGKSLIPRKSFRIGEEKSKLTYYKAVNDAENSGHIVKTRNIRKSSSRKCIPITEAYKFPPGLKWSTTFLAYIKNNYPQYEPTLTCSGPIWNEYKKFHSKRKIGGVNKTIVNNEWISSYAIRRKSERIGSGTNLPINNKVNNILNSLRIGGECPCKKKKKKKRKGGQTQNINNILNSLNNSKNVGPLISNFYSSSVYSTRKEGLINTMISLKNSDKYNDVSIRDLSEKVLADDAGLLNMPWGVGGEYELFVDDLENSYSPQNFQFEQTQRTGGVSFSQIRRGLAKKILPPFTVEDYIEKRDYFLEEIDHRLISIAGLNEYVLAKNREYIPVGDRIDTDEVAIKLEIDVVFEKYIKNLTTNQFKWGVGKNRDDVIDRAFQDWQLKTLGNFRCNSPFEYESPAETVEYETPTIAQLERLSEMVDESPTIRPPSYRTTTNNDRLSEIEKNISDILNILGKKK